MSILDLYNKKVPTTGKIDTKGKDKQPIETGKEDDKTLEKARHGALGKGAGGYDSSKKYSDSVKR